MCFYIEAFVIEAEASNLKSFFQRKEFTVNLLTKTMVRQTSKGNEFVTPIHFLVKSQCMFNLL